MNKLILIGNGFDLAHGLKTRYSDFLLWYLRKSLNKLHNTTRYEDELIILENHKPQIRFNLESLEKFKFYLNHFSIKCEYKSKFIEKLINDYTNFRWVDIENQYYLALIGIYKILERNNTENTSLVTVQLEALNKSFDFLKKVFEEYLSTIVNKLEDGLPEIFMHFDKELFENYSPNAEDVNLFLNFNYTATIELYKNRNFSDNKFKVNYIHGKLGDKNNPIIFGYGDEMDSFYEKIERSNCNEFLRNIKSFYYLKTNNYQNFSGFIDSRPFEVLIMGHSCGLSDRILLNSIFEHENCKKIKIFYHKKSEDDNDYTEKIQEMSRHFKVNKHKMRNIIISELDSVPLIPYKKIDVFNSN